MLRTENAIALMRYPRFEFRPSQSDALHVDLWHKGINLLRDAGTCSYNALGLEWYAGTAAHNTVEFDERDQMPRLGRFLFGNWLSADSVELVMDDGNKVTATAAYTDKLGARHQRELTLTKDGMICRDTISGSFKKACLRWRMAPVEWCFDGETVHSELCDITVEVNESIVTPILGATQESLYYQQKSKIPEIRVYLDAPSIITTRLSF